MPPKNISPKKSRKVSRKVSKKASRKVSRKASRKVSKKASRKVSKKASRKVSKKASRKVSRKVSKKVSRKLSRKVSRKVSKKASRKVSRKASRKVSRKVPEKKIVNKDSKFDSIMKNLKLNITMKDFPLEFIRVLGEGFFGIVYLVKYNGKLAVLKINKKSADTKSYSRFDELKEIYSSIMFSGKKYFPTIIKIFYKNNSENDTEFFVLSEYFEAENFGDFLKKIKTSDEIQKMEEKIKNMIDWLCDNDIVHGDMHYGNIMVVKTKDDYDLKLVDFGYSTFGVDCMGQFEYIKLLQSLLYFNKELGIRVAKYVEERYKNDDYIKQCIKSFKGFSKNWSENSMFLSKCYIKNLENVKGPGVAIIKFDIKNRSKFIFRTKKYGDREIDFKNYKEYFQEI